MGIVELEFVCPKIVPETRRTLGFVHSQFFAGTNAWEIGWTAHGTKKHGWHFLVRSTTSAWPRCSDL